MMAYFVLPFKALSVSQTHFELQSPAGSLCLLHYCQPHGLETLPVHRGPLFLHWSVVSPIQRGFSGLCTATISTKPRCWIPITRFLYFTHETMGTKVLTRSFSSPSVCVGIWISNLTAVEVGNLQHLSFSKLSIQKQTEWLQSLFGVNKLTFFLKMLAVWSV